MSKIISMQDIRVSLAAIADEAEAGESFVVIRNSKPAFRIEPPERGVSGKKRSALTLGEITGRLDKASAGSRISARELDAIIHEAHGRGGAR
ncbi:MAG: hypothetical protein V1809_16240 [Planctomycetota bacterium]